MTQITDGAERAWTLFARQVSRLMTRLADPARRSRTMLATLAVYALVWAAYGTIAKFSQDVHPDMAELVTWSRNLAWGYSKHPPLAAWLVALWFSVFPVADWSYYLLAALVPTTGLWLVWRMSDRYLAADRPALGVALLTLIPFFGVLALKFNVNTLLIPLWAATAWCLLRSIETRSLVWAAAAGLCAAAAMLTKYWSIFLILGLAGAILLDRRRLDYLRSPLPWVTTGVGLLALAPHLVWLVTSGFAPFTYMQAAHPPASLSASAVSAVGYLLGALGYVALPVFLALALTMPTARTLRDMAWPADETRRLPALMFWLPLLLPVAAAMTVNAEITSLWSMSAWALLPVVLLSSPLLETPRPAVLRIAGLAVAFPVLMLLASPWIALLVHRGGLPPDQTHGSLVAPAVQRLWHETTPAPLQIVAGDMSFGIAFYLPEKATGFPNFDKAEAIWIDEARVKRDGMVAVCRITNPTCLAKGERRAGENDASRTQDITVTRRFLGLTGRTDQYRLWAIPPRL